jgi:hypothetical protein
MLVDYCGERIYVIAFAGQVFFAFKCGIAKSQNKKGTHRGVPLHGTILGRLLALFPVQSPLQQGLSISYCPVLLDLLGDLGPFFLHLVEVA